MWSLTGWLLMDPQKFSDEYLGGIQVSSQILKFIVVIYVHAHQRKLNQVKT